MISAQVHMVDVLYNIAVLYDENGFEVGRLRSSNEPLWEGMWWELEQSWWRASAGGIFYTRTNGLTDSDLWDGAPGSTVTEDCEAWGMAAQTAIDSPRTARGEQEATVVTTEPIDLDAMAGKWKRYVQLVGLGDNWTEAQVQEAKDIIRSLFHSTPELIGKIYALLDENARLRELLAQAAEALGVASGLVPDLTLGTASVKKIFSMGRACANARDAIEATLAGEPELFLDLTSETDATRAQDEIYRHFKDEGEQQ